MGVRKNAIDLTIEERDKFINAAKALKSTGANGSAISIYDQFVAIHLGVFELRRGSGRAAGVDGGHNNAAFLPWHREYLRRFELALQEVDEDVSLPYWDWTDPRGTQETIFQNDFMGPNGGQSGIGGGTVRSGHFTSDAGWPVVESLHGRRWGGGDALGTSLVRRMQPFTSLPTSADVNEVLRLNTYARFRPGLERAPLHNFIHGWIGGSMARMTSPNDLIFFMHHAFVDRIWAQWQDNEHAGSDFYPAGGQPYGHNATDRMWPWDGGQSNTVNGLQDLIPVFAPNDIVRPVDVMDYRGLGYTYDEPISELIPDGPAIDSDISVPGEEGVFQLQIANAGRYRIETQGPTDVVMSLFESNDRINLIAQDDDSGDSRNSRIISQLTAGTYIVVIRHFRSNGTGSYRIFTRTESESPVPNPNPNPITELTVGGSALQSSIGEPGEVDVFQFEVPEIGRYSIQTQGPTDIIMSLFGPNNSSNLVTTDDDSGEEFNAKIAGRLTAGIYFVEVRHYSNTRTGNYSISIRAEEEAIPTLEVNGSEFEGAIEASNESDLYTFSASEGGEYLLETSSNTDTFLTLLGPDNQTTLIAQDDDSGPGSNSRITADLTSGVYFARVRHYRPTGTGPYRISVKK